MQICNNQKKNIANIIYDKTFQFAFFSALLIGSIVHFPSYSKRLTTADGVWTNVIHDGIDWEISLGRWGLALLKSIRFDFVLYSLSAFLGILSLALSAAFLVCLFKVRRKINIILMNLLFLSFPAIGALMPLWFCSGDYFLACFLAVFSVWLVTEFKDLKTFLMAILLFAFSLGIYQAYFSIAASLCLFLLLKDCLLSDSNEKEILIKSAKYLLYGIIGTLVYISIMKITQMISGINPASYAGLNKIGQGSISDLFYQFSRAYSGFLKFYFGDWIFNNTFWKRQYLYAFLFLLFGILCVFIVKNRKLYLNWNKICLLCTFVILSPLMICALEVISPERGIYCLTSTSLIMPFVFLVSMLEGDTGSDNSFLKYGKRLLTLGLIALSYSYILYTNTAYMAMEINYNKTYSTALRIIDRVENTEAYSKTTKVLLVGTSVDNENLPPQYPKVVESLGLEHIATWGLVWPDYIGYQATWYNFMLYYCGQSFPICTKQEYDSVVSTQEFRNMPLFPSKDAVKTIGNIIVVKMNEG